MRNKFAVFLMLAGVCSVIASGLLFFHNMHEDNLAGRSAKNVVLQLEDTISEIKEDEKSEEVLYETGTILINEQEYMGYISLPSIGKRLPVMAQWDYDALQTAPCRYSGSIEERNIVIAAHNYTHHFGQLSDLHMGEEIFFTDVGGNTTEYQVTEIEKLMPDEVEKMIVNDADLSLFTCDYSGANRVTVRCREINNRSL